jgi:vacuolar-type H+-ATPase subunit F/Vma7
VSNRLAVLASPATAGGWRLAGLALHETPSPTDGAVALARLAEDPEIGVLLVEQAIYDALDADQRLALSRRPLQMVVPFPDPAWDAGAPGADAVIAELLRQAIGYRVRLR